MVRFPLTFHSDNHSNFKEGLFCKLLKKIRISPTYTEPHSPWLNRVEPNIGEVKLHARSIMQHANTPIWHCVFAMNTHQNFFPYVLQAALNFEVEHLMKLSQIIRLMSQNIFPISGFNGVGPTTKKKEWNNYVGGFPVKWFWENMMLLYYPWFRRIHITFLCYWYWRPWAYIIMHETDMLKFYDEFRIQNQSFKTGILWWNWSKINPTLCF